MAKPFTPETAIKNIKPQEFDTHGIYHIKCGKKINNYDFIQENRVDCEIYPTLEKYGTIQPLICNKQILAEELEALDLMDIKNQRIKANEMWENLPLEIRQKFNNDQLQFLQDGPKWLQDELAKEKQPEPQPEPKEDSK